MYGNRWVIRYVTELNVMLAEYHTGRSIGKKIKTKTKPFHLNVLNAVESRRVVVVIASATLKEF